MYAIQIETMTGSVKDRRLCEFLRLGDARFISAVARGHLDVAQLAKEELKERGLDIYGKWVPPS